MARAWGMSCPALADAEVLALGAVHNKPLTHWRTPRFRAIDEFIVRLGYAAAVSVRSCARRDASPLALSPARRSQVITRPRPKRAPVSGRGLGRKRRKSGQLSSWGCRERGDASPSVMAPRSCLLTATARCRCLLPAPSPERANPC